MADEGVAIGGVIGKWDGKPGKSLGGCKQWCEDTVGCNSIAWDSVDHDCHIKKKCLTSTEASKTYRNFKSYYLPCNVAGALY